MARILVYEDDESLSILFQQIITSSGRICKVVSTPQEISSEAQTAQYDMFLIDMQNIAHPGSECFGHAYDIARKIKYIQPNTILIAMSVCPPEFCREAEENGFDDIADKTKLLAAKPLGDLFAEYNI